MVRFAWMLAWGLVAGAAHGAVYRCETNGEVVFTDRSCAAGAKPAELAPLGVMPASDAADLAEQHDERVVREQEAHAKADRAWLKKHADREAEERRIQAAIDAKKVVAGMTTDQVHRVFGRPDRVDHDAGREVWSWGGEKVVRTVVFEDGRVAGGKGAGVSAGKGAGRNSGRSARGGGAKDAAGAGDSRRSGSRSKPH